MESIVDKVKKLLALSTSSNQHEAAVALSKAHELIARYNLVIKDENEKVVVEYVLSEATKSVSNFKKYLSSILSKHFGVKIVLSNHEIDSKLNDGRMHTRLVVLGRKSDVACFASIYEYTWKVFCKEFDSVDTTDSATRSNTIRLKWSFFKGFCEGITNELISEISKTALVITVPEEVEKKVAAMVHSVFSTPNVEEDALYEKGYVKGVDAIRIKGKRIENA